MIGDNLSRIVLLPSGAEASIVRVYKNGVAMVRRLSDREMFNIRINHLRPKESGNDLASEAISGSPKLKGQRPTIPVGSLRVAKKP